MLDIGERGERCERITALIDAVRASHTGFHGPGGGGFCICGIRNVGKNEACRGLSELRDMLRAATVPDEWQGAREDFLSMLGG